MELETTLDRTGKALLQSGWTLPDAEKFVEVMRNYLESGSSMGMALNAAINESRAYHTWKWWRGAEAVRQAVRREGESDGAG